ncbi:small multi-drug export protein [Natronococcus occultus]|uniref:Putative small multi-drug export protein n=1 Tax=Natronococcus occultus SP4 TaxID=694430 RepID=L0K420_9EURY|nr:small multi-drug export protein [Natronococcus occultus]AGB38838.1 Putative small multi-drug export protein [Natronococcus occultus SP4]
MIREQLTELWRRFGTTHPLPWGLAIGIGVLVALAVTSADPFAALDSETVRELVRHADGSVQYVLIFLLAAVPILEILVVVPVGIGLGLDPLAVAVFAFFGNVLPIYGIIVLYERLQTWWEGRTDSSGTPSKRRALALWNRYGLPGLALVSPVATGVHLAAAIALAVGSRKRSVAVWMTASIALWTILFTAGTYYGIGYLTGL